MTSYGPLPSLQTIPLLPSEHSCAPSTPSEYYLPDILCLSELGDEQSGPANLMNALHSYPMLRHRIKSFTQSFQRQAIWNKIASQRTNLVTLMSLDIQ
jgi:hypothetical protein